MYTSKVLDQVPSSFRKPVSSSRGAQELMTYQNTAPGNGLAGRAAAAARSRFVRLPNEPEDARLTGVTRSLDRRLLALNLRGTRLAELMLVQAKIA